MEAYAAKNSIILTAHLKIADKEGKGLLTEDQFVKTVATIGPKFTREELRKILAERKIARSPDGVFSYESLMDKITDGTSQVAVDNDKRLAEILKLLTCKLEKSQIPAFRTAMASLQLTEPAQSILKKTGGTMSAEEFQKKFPAAWKSSREASEILEEAKKTATATTTKESKTIQPYICPSVLSSDFARLAEECKKMIDLGAHWLHMDVMDGHFVPNLTIGAPVIKSLRKHTTSCLDCHLMVSNPEQWVDDFKKAGADTFCFHLEAVEDPNKLLDKLDKLGIKSGIALKPDTPVDAVFPYCNRLHHVLIMTVEPGFGGQSFMWWTMPKVAAIRARFPALNIQVDGGVKTHTIDACSKAGANVIVSGSGIFGQKNPGEVIKAMTDSVSAYQ